MNSVEGLTLKQHSFLTEYLRTGNGTKAALLVYDTDDYASAASIAYENLKKLQKLTPHLLEFKGIDLGLLIDTLSAGLNATKLGKRLVDGKIALVEVPDYAVRHKYLETAARWLGVESTSANQTNLIGEQLDMVIKDYRSKPPEGDCKC